MTRASRNAGVLPEWTSVLAVVAHPDDESFGLGAILDAFTRTGATVEVLCLTHGEASTLHGASGDLASVRGAELVEAADLLGVTRARLRDHPDGALSELSGTTLSAEVVAAAQSCCAAGLLVFDTAELLNLPVLGWTLPEAVAAQLNQEFGASFTGHKDQEIDLSVRVDRARQLLASAAHVSQALPGSVLWRRLDLLADTESLRWLRPPIDVMGRPGALARRAKKADSSHRRPLRVEHRGGDQFEIKVRDHVIRVDQPVEDGGENTASTPTELFIASLASCVAFYARRYLARHNLPTHGLAVEATFEMGARPARVAAIDLRLIVPDGLPPERLDPLLAVATHCTVHNTLATTPEVSITLAEAVMG
jgi:uncharacterized OsmC-like protein